MLRTISIIIVLALLPLMLQAETMTVVHSLSGSGFFINRDTIVTNAHVVKGCGHVTIQGAVPQHAVTVKVVDESHDLALLESDEPPAQFAPLRFNIEDLKPGDKVLVIGYPGEEGARGVYTMAEAQIEKPLDPAAAPPGQFLITDVIAHGNSGGPVFDMSGNVIGVVVAKEKATYAMTDSTGVTTEQEQNLGVVISLDTLKQFLFENGAFAQWTSSGLLTFPSDQIKEQARALIVNVQCEVSRETVPAPVQP